MAYATQADLTNVGLPAVALATLSNAQITAQLQAASDEADSYFRARYGNQAVPLAAWDTTVTHAVAKLTVWNLMLVRGLKPGAPDWVVFKQRYEEAIDWLGKVQRQQAHPKVTLASAGPFPGGAQPVLVSTSVVDLQTGRTAPNRGW